MKPTEDKLSKKLESILNEECAENDSNTPDFILAEYLLGCLSLFNKTIKKREDWYGVPCYPGMEKVADKKKGNIE